jgi:hypothetical protein
MKEEVIGFKEMKYPKKPSVEALNAIHTDMSQIFSALATDTS